ncbi:MAG: lactate dehydrogenase [Pedobacter sp.]|nr:MAG: lactate dehydrogenase [Pedobacter sp.]
MRVVAYSIKSTEKEPLAIANHKKHEITLISNPLTEATVSFATGKDAVVVFTDDDVSAAVIKRLAALGVKYIATRSTDRSNIDLKAAVAHHMKIANVSYKAISGISEEQIPMILAVETINNLDKWEGRKCLGDACICSRTCN